MQHNRSLLITGASGFLGRFVLRELLTQQPDLRVHILARSAASRAKICNFLNKNGQSPTLNFVTGDLTQPNLGLSLDAVAALRNEVTEVWHVAAITNLASQDSDLLYGTNVRGTARLLRVAEQLPHLTHFYYVSTAYVAGIHSGPVREQALPARPQFRNLYERSKFTAERLVLRSRLPVVVFRPSIIVGDSVSGDTGDDCQTVYRFVHALVAGLRRTRGNDSFTARAFKQTAPVSLDFRIPGSSRMTLNFVCVDEVARLMVTLSERTGAEQVLNLTNLRDLTGTEIRIALEQALNVHGIEFFEKAPPSPRQGERTTLTLSRPFLPYIKEPGPVWETSRGLDLAAGNWMPVMTADKFANLMRTYLATNSEKQP
jgi:nucleoside-diphosphate-sugar epimerase